MHRIGVYAVSLIAASMISALLQALMPAGGRKQILRIICAVFLLLTLLTPLSGVQLPDFSDYLAGFQSEGEAAAALGQEMALTERQELIILGLQSYILDKAAAHRYFLKMLFRSLAASCSSIADPPLQFPDHFEGPPEGPPAGTV